MGDCLRPQAPHVLYRHIMPPTGTYPLDWQLFARHFATPRVDPSRPRFPEKWQFILARAFRKCSLDAAHKWGVEGSPPLEVC